MSNTDSFIDEVTEEVRRDRMFAFIKRYGWIGVLGVLLIVGGASWNEWQKAQTRQAAEATGDAMLAALDKSDTKARVKALSTLKADTPGAAAITGMLAAGELGVDDPAQAVTHLLAVADNAKAPEIYRQIATIKAVSISDSGPESGMSDADRRARLDKLTGAVGLIRLLADEQLALIDLRAGKRDAALKEFQAIARDAEVSPSMRARVAGVIVALGAKVPAAPQLGVAEAAPADAPAVPGAQ